MVMILSKFKGIKEVLNVFILNKEGKCLEQHYELF